MFHCVHLTLQPCTACIATSILCTSTVQVIASKNSLLGLDLHEPSTSVAPTRKRNRSPKRRKNMSPAKRRKSSPTGRNASSARQNASPECSGSPVAPVNHATPKHNKERKLVADAVVQALSSYYKQKRIASKVNYYTAAVVYLAT